MGLETHEIFEASGGVVRSHLGLRIKGGIMRLAQLTPGFYFYITYFSSALCWYFLILGFLSWFFLDSHTYLLSAQLTIQIV
jgi:hypothetical protein